MKAFLETTTAIALATTTTPAIPMPPTGVYTGREWTRAADVHRARIIYNSVFNGSAHERQRPMSLTLSIDELLRYSAEERDTWRRWLQANPAAIDAPMQTGGRFPTVGKLIDHIFLVERRHLQRLRGQTLAQATGLTGNNVSPLFIRRVGTPRDGAVHPIARRA